jgi:hypothetical protein
VEKLLKRFKTQRCAIYFDSSFCKAVFHSDDGENISGAATSSLTNVNFFVAAAESLVMLVNEFVLSTQKVVQNSRAN